MYKIQRMAKKDATEEEASHQNPKDGRQWEQTAAHESMS